MKISARAIAAGYAKVIKALGFRVRPTKSAKEQAEAIDLKWEFGIEYVGGWWEWLPRWVDDGFLYGFFVGYWFVGLMR